jgi:outer membrane protein assembly factor BamB
MATLEVHDGEGRVQFVELARDHPVLFGTSAACDIVLSGEGICPVQGRIRWKKGRYRVEASPDAEYVVINGHKMTSSSLHQGDEMTVGRCRLFMLRLDETLEARPAGRPAKRSDEERTRVLEGPGHLHFSPGRGGTAAGGIAAPRPASSPPMPAQSPLERDDWLQELAMKVEQEIGAESVEPQRHPSARGQFSGRSAGPRQTGQQAAGPLGRMQRWFRALRDERALAPGRERIVSSPLVVALVLSLGLLLLLGLGLRSIIIKTLADQRYNRAVEVMQDGDYRTAIRDFDAFLTSHPKDPRAGKARVLRALANVRQYVSISGGTWSTALEAAQQMYGQVGAEPEFRDERGELAELVIRIGEGLADRARQAADAKALQEAESTVPLHAQIAGEPAPAFLKRSRLPGLLEDGRAAVRKANTRAQALSAMDLAISNGSASGAYKARDALIDRYADLTQDRELIARMTQANELIRRAVKVDPARQRAATDPRPEPLGLPTSLVLRSTAERPSGTPAPESIAYALADGFAYALDAATGAPRWQLSVGLASPFAPQPVAGDSTVLVVDARHDDLLRLDAGTGKLIWRQKLGEPLESPPLVLGEQLYQLLPSGSLVVMALKSGEQQARVKLGVPLSQAPVSDEQGRFLYVLGRRDSLFVLARDGLACLAVEYLGHEEGSIPCPPVRIGRFLIVIENDRPTDSRWRVLILDEEGAKVRQVQQIDVPGWSWGVPASSGSVIWATGDKGGVEAFALGDYASNAPLRSLARLNPDAAASGPAFGMALSERELWLGAGRSGRYVLDPERGEIAAQSSLGQPGAAPAPVQSAGRRVVLTFQYPHTGGVSLVGVDPVAGSVAWQTVLGAPWPTPLERTRGGDALKTLGQTGREVVLSLKQLHSGGFVEIPVPRAGEARVPSGKVLVLEGDGRETLVIVPGNGASAVWVEDAQAPGHWRPLELPSALAAAPLAWGRDLLIPGADGRAYLIDPVTAQSKAEPLVPVYNRERRGRWRAPVRLNAMTVVLADDAGRVRLLSLQQKPVPRLVVEAEKLLEKGIVADPATTGGAVILATADQRVRVLSARDLSPVGAWPLEAPLLGSPVTAGERCFVFDSAGGILALGPDGRRLWSIKLDAAVAGPPLIQDDLVWLLDREGHLHARSLADGAAREQLELGVLPTGGLLQVGPEAIVPVARGTVQLLALHPGLAR